MSHLASHKRSALLAAIVAYLLWGVLPVYWKLLASHQSLEILCYRIIGAFVLLALVCWSRRRTTSFPTIREASQKGPAILLSAALIAANWLTYIWGVNSGKVVECSLGYFILPIFSTAIGLAVLHEKSDRAKLAALTVASIAVAIKVWAVGGIPIVSLVLALTFLAYGLLKRSTQFDPLTGLLLETFVLLPFAFGYLFLGNYPIATHATDLLLLFGAGLVSIVPLFFFAYAVRRIPFSTLGPIQYLAPALQFAIGVAVYHEPMTMLDLLSFGLIWLSLAILPFSHLRHIHLRGHYGKAQLTHD